MIEVRILADSVNPVGDRLTTFLCIYPRIIHPEVLTHRALSRNSASSRAIPITKLIQRVEANPYIPDWHKAKKGMAVAEKLDPHRADRATFIWRRHLRQALEDAAELAALGASKGEVNRLLEPFMHIETVISGTDWANFFALRTAHDAQPEFQDLARAMLRAYRASTPSAVAAGDWHIPFGDRMPAGLFTNDRLRVAIARCARISYITHEGAIDADRDIALFNQLVHDGHFSPLEHVAMALSSSDRFGNMRGWMQFRKFHENEERTWADVPESTA